MTPLQKFLATAFVFGGMVGFVTLAAAGLGACGVTP